MGCLPFTPVGRALSGSPWVAGLRPTLSRVPLAASARQRSQPASIASRE